MTTKHLFISLLATLLAVALASGSAAADDPPDIEIINAGYGGTGCPDGTATAVISEDRRSVSVLFDAYNAETAEDDWRVRKSCNIAVSLLIPAGFSVSLLQIDYRGYANIPSGGRGWFRSEYFFAGDRGPVYLHPFTPGHETNYLLTNWVGGAVWSPCGMDVIARANTSILAERRRSRPTDEASVTVDTADIRGGIIYHLDWRTC